MATGDEAGLGDLLKKVKNQFCNDRGAYHIVEGNRFGQDVVLIRCITDVDRVRIKNLIEKNHRDWPIQSIYFMAPIWNFGDLLPEYRKKIDEVIKDGSYGNPDSPARKKFEELQEEAHAAEWAFWSSLSEERKKTKIRELILKIRSLDPHGANCGDKFLKTE